MGISQFSDWCCYEQRLTQNRESFVGMGYSVLIRDDNGLLFADCDSAEIVKVMRGSAADQKMKVTGV